MRSTPHEKAPSVIEDSIKIQILLHEYDTLRSENVARYSGVLQITGIGAAALLILLGISSGDAANEMSGITVAFLVFGIAVYLYAIGLNLRDTIVVGRRIAALETIINRRAGENLLEWESRWGGAKAGFWGLVSPFPRRRRNVPVR